MDEYCVILFYSTNYAIWTKDILQKAGIEHKMVSVPRHLSSDCGYCVKIQRQDQEKILPLLQENKIQFDRIESL